MFLRKTTFSILLMLLILPILSAAGTGNCKPVEKKTLARFFANEKKWTEVESPDSNKIASDPVIRISLDFTNIDKSQVKVGKKKLAQVADICLISENELQVITNKAHIRISQIGDQHLRSDMKVLGKKLTYYYLPSDMVVEL